MGGTPVSALSVPAGIGGGGSNVSFSTASSGSPTGAAAAAAAAPASPLLSHLDLRGLELTDDFVNVLCSVLPRMLFRSVDLSDNRITDASCAMLATCTANPLLHTVDLSRNPGIQTASGAVLELLRSAEQSAVEFRLSLTDFCGERGRTRCDFPLAGVRYDPTSDSRLVTWCDASEKIVIWDAALSGTGVMVPYVEFHPKWVGWDCKGQRLAAACAAGRTFAQKQHQTCVLVYESNIEQKAPWKIAGQSDYINARFHPTEQNLLLAWMSGRSFSIYNVEKRQHLKSMSIPLMMEKAIPKHAFIWSRGDGNPDLLLWGQKTRLALMVLPLNPGSASVPSDFEERVKRWGDPVKIERPHLMSCKDVALRPSKSELIFATCGQDKNIHFWDSRGKKKRTFVMPGKKTEGLEELVWSCDGSIIFAAMNTTVIAWDWVAGSRVGEFSGVHDKTIWGMALSPSGGTLATCSQDGGLALWHCKSSGVVRTERLVPPDPSDAGELPHFSSLSTQPTEDRRTICDTASSHYTQDASPSHCSNTYTSHYSSTYITTSDQVSTPSRPPSVSRYFINQ
eukprot:TRINITY_DN31194_c0_g1_i1.p1 TRINITY_DN31194_c0_g1~~TRINITY_DN31194_c0_g1_i1.p1  ORF type:complete len:600 (+),score=209.41 TRINITY_DN31194_c0_g1_i1:104-1801(+)